MKILKIIASTIVILLMSSSLLVGISAFASNDLCSENNRPAVFETLSYRSITMGHPNFSNVMLPEVFIPGYSISEYQKTVEIAETINFDVLNPEAVNATIAEEDDKDPEEEENTFFFHGFKGNNQHSGYVDLETSNKISMLWRYFFYGDYITNIQVYGDQIFFADHSGYVHSINAKDASTNWKYPLEEKRYVAGIDISLERMYITFGPIFSRRGIEDDSSLIYAVDLKTGKEVWHKRIEQELMVSPPLVDGDLVYVASGRMNSTFTKTAGGKISCFDTKGDVIQTFEIEEFSFYGGYITKSGDVIMAAAYKYDRASRTFIPPQLYAFNTIKDRQVWYLKPLEEYGFLGTPSIKDGYIYVTENPMRMGRRGGGTPKESWLQKVNIETGKLEQSMVFKDENFGNFAPSLAKDAIYLASFTGRIYCINYDLERLWWHEKYDRFSYFTELLASKNYLYTILYEGDFICLSKADGKIDYRYATGNYGRMPVVTGEEVYVSGNALYCFSENAEPILYTEPSTIYIQDVNQGEIVQRSFRVVWTGTDKMNGNVFGTESWVKITPKTITQNIQSCFVTIDTGGLPKGKNTAKILVETNKGNKTIELEITILVTEPLTLYVNIPDEGVITNDAEFVLEGETDPFAKVLINGYIVYAYQSGYFYDRIRLVEGENPVNILVTAKDGREIDFQGMITKDTIPPQLIVDLPRVLETDSKTVVITGKIELGATLKIGTKEVTFREDGSFTYEYTMKKEEEIVRIRAKDEAENTTQVKIKLIYTE
ncbi:MAG: PQQ-binding-like beta-propeller repeat protein [Caldisericia bacterium]|nr:PQQ-binding-like beta-propeller repeat protein [Caldisericia bacterium]